MHGPLNSAGPNALLHAAREVTRDLVADGPVDETVRGDAGVEVLELVPSPVMVVGSDRRVLFANRAHAAAFGPPEPGATCCSIAGCGTQEDGSWHGCLTDLLLRGDRASLQTVATRDARGRRRLVSAARLGPRGSKIVFRVRPAEPEERPDDAAWGGAEPDRLQVTTLGNFEVRTSGGTTFDREWLGQRPGRLLKYLVVRRGRPVSADDIADALWPRAMHGDSGAVRHAVHLLRRRLEPNRSGNDPSRFLLTTNGRYSLNLDEVWIDADGFETAVRTGLQAFVTADLELADRSLQRSLNLYGGDFLPDDVYADWTMEERERLRGLVEVPLRVLAELRLGRGDGDGAAQYLERLSRLEPFDGDVHRLLVEVLLRQGRRTRAMRHYEMFSTRLMRDFGVRPDFDLQSCQRRIGQPLHAL
jgi:DNA-binding SARP family transcriptional activator